jgi:hypothetical protein
MSYVLKALLIASRSQLCRQRREPINPDNARGTAVSP